MGEIEGGKVRGKMETVSEKDALFSIVLAIVDFVAIFLIAALLPNWGGFLLPPPFL